jgi:hypothetical protein
MRVRFLLASAVAAARKLLIVVDEWMVTQIFTSWNRLTSWLRALGELPRAV